MLYASDFRRIAREALTGRWGDAVGTGFVACLLGAGGSTCSSNFNWTRNYDNMHSRFNSGFLLILLGILSVLFVYGLIMFFFRGAVQLGYCRFNKNLLDRNNPQFRDLFSSFNIFWRGFAMQFLIGIYIFLWSLLFIIPGIIAAYSYAMTPYILEENPYMPISDALRRSKDMMSGNRWRLFCLEVSFIGWSLLCLLTCGIGFLWLIPYTNAATAAFYYDVSGKYRAQFIPPYNPVPPYNPANKNYPPPYQLYK